MVFQLLLSSRWSAEAYSKKLRCTDYVRWCDYETGEAVVKYRDKNGLWERRTFTSRADNVTVTK